MVLIHEIYILILVYNLYISLLFRMWITLLIILAKGNNRKRIPLILIITTTFFMDLKKNLRGQMGISAIKCAQ